MGEELTKEQQKLYQYAGNSNLVLQSDRSGLARRGERGKEVESLYGKIDARDMGANVRHEAPPKAPTQGKTRREQRALRTNYGYTNILAATEDIEGVAYRPRSRETRRVWEMILAQARKYLGDQAPEVLMSATDEALAVLKNDNVREREKKKQTEFSVFIQLARQITDYEDEPMEVDAGRPDAQSGMAVAGQFVVDGESSGSDSEDDEDRKAPEDHGSDVGSVQGDDEAGGYRTVIHGFGKDAADDGSDTEMVDAPDRLPPRSIDAFWLQREIGKHFPDHMAALRLLANRRLAAGELENELAELFDYDHFETVQVLVQNRELIAEDDSQQKTGIEEEMRENGLGWIAQQQPPQQPPQQRQSASSQDVVMEEAKANEPRDFEPRQTIDLAELAFTQGGHLMTNEKWVPPKGAEKEIRVPAPERPPPAGDDEPIWSRTAFPGAKELNRVQSRADDNMLICAPTGAGKTNCAALTMMRTIGQFRDSATGEINVDQFKMALVAEVAGSFSKRLAPLGISLTKQQIAATQLIVTTPEKWDVITRKGGEGSYTQLVRLVIIDEIHLLHDDRGPVLEALEQTQQRVRLVGLSATLPNYEDVATFLRVPRDRALFHFDARFRPCPLQQEFHIKRLERMDQVCYDKVKKHAQGSQVLVFTESQTGLAILEDAAESTRDQALKELLPFGFGCHHAGMSKADRGQMEDLFANGRLKVLVSTATLAWGVNLPAHAVIIKGTQLSPQDVLQMLGRAGRPQYDTFGEGLRYYLSLLNQQLPIESQLMSRLADALNAEVALGTIRSRNDAVDWLGYTYLPSVYGVPGGEIDEDPALVGRPAVELARSAMVQLAHRDIDILRFRLIPVRAEERRVPAKINVLLQAHIASLGLTGFALVSDMVYVTQSAGRIFRALFELCLPHRVLGWCKQFGRACPTDLVRSVERKPFPWARYLGELVGSPKAGRLLHGLVHLVPRLEVSAHLRLTPDFRWQDAFWIWRMLHSELFVLKKLYVGQEHPLPPQYFVCTRLAVSFNCMTLSSSAFTRLPSRQCSAPRRAPARRWLGSWRCCGFSSTRRCGRELTRWRGHEHMSGSSGLHRCRAERLWRFCQATWPGDLKRIENAHIIWRARQHHAVREIGLVIADELHCGSDYGAGADLVGDQLAATYEVVVSRIERPIRIIALSVPLANARDVAAWIGAPPSAVFNFSPAVRPTSTIPHFASRMAALAAPTYRAVCGDPSREPAIVFVPSRRQCRVVAGELLTLAAADGASIIESAIGRFLAYGVGYYHEALTDADRQTVTGFRETCWALDSVHAQTVHRYVDYSIPDVLQMMGRASRPGIDTKGLCRELYKKFLYEPLPLDEIQEAVDYLTWTLMYRRLGTTHPASIRLPCVTLDDDEVGVSATNLGIISAFYQIRYLTVEMFALSLAAKTKLRGVLDIVSAADEFEALPIRHREAHVLNKIARRCPLALPSTSNDSDDGRWNSPRVRTHLLLQAHFSRLALPADLAADQAWVLARVMPLLQALVDAPALASMELSQMCVQAMQVPHLGGSERLQMCESMQVDSVFAVMDMEDEDRANQVAEVAAYVNRYPNIEVEFEVAGEVHANGIVSLVLSLDREWDEEEEGDIPGPVIAPFFPYARAEGWWVVIADGQTLVNVRKISVGKELQRTIKFAAPEVAGQRNLKMFLMCDGYLGCDQELDVELDVLPPEEESDSE
ncbi:Sec63-domain-containing protein [Linderina pennispora]|uniref:Sec63-domain-containing protein n=1 Tax=Linderina pennispora TaxID=61395 RepID=A0A1Y1W3I3_9FUNG|nr:Sec63-domain-containing protein [Linderina pennispora]ORX68028.1 Sec63-domain-containing protein [Linderina pennispora]